MDDVHFNLLDEPWILALGKDGKMKKPLTLRELYADAHECADLAGELPTQNAAVLRLLLAILYAVFLRVDETGAEEPLEYSQEALDRWKRLWNRGCFPADVINGYLDKYHERFDMFHPERPFLQVKPPDNPVTREGITIKPTGIKIGKFVGDVSDGDRVNLFAGRSTKEGISFAEAARWLIYLNSYDVAPAGNPGKNPRSIKGFARPWTAQIGLTWLAGKSLFETLMLNFVLLDHNDNCWPITQAFWEADSWSRSADDLVDIERHKPESPLEILGAQYRHVALRRDDTVITGYDLWSGMTFGGIGKVAENVMAERMTPWRKDKDGNYTPRTHNPAKLMWRDLAAFVPSGNKDILPGVVRWQKKLKGEDVCIPPMRICIAGAEYGSMNASINDVFADSLSLNAALLVELDEVDEADVTWSRMVIKEVEKTEECAKLIGILASDLAIASGGSGDRKDKNIKGKRDLALRDAFYALDNPFRHWLASIDPEKGDEVYEISKLWRNEVERILSRIGKELVANAGQSAFIGKRIKMNNVERTKNAPEAYRWFKYSLMKSLEQ